MVKKAILLVAGYGTRFLPATKNMPKEMLPIVDKPIVQYLVEEVVAAGIEEIIFVTGRGKRSIEDHFDKSFESIISSPKSTATGSLPTKWRAHNKAFPSPFGSDCLT